MEKRKVNLLVIEDDEDRISSIKYSLGGEFYLVEASLDWKDGLDKILENRYDLIVVSHTLSKTRGEVHTFLEQVKNRDQEKLNIPFVISITPRDEREKIREILEGKKFAFVNKDSEHYVYDLELEIINLVPKVSSIFKEHMQDFLKKYEKVKRSLEDVDDLKENLQQLNRDLKIYVKWENLAETLSLLVGAFSLAIGIIIAIILAFFNQSIDFKDIKIPSIPLFLVLALVISGTWTLSYIFYKKRIMKKVDDKISEFQSRKRRV